MTNLPSVPPKETRAIAMLICTACGAPGEGSCGCGAPYVPPGQRAAEAVRQSPEKSDRAIAADLGIGKDTVRRVREATGACAPVQSRIGLDGKTRKMPRKTEIPEARKTAAAHAVLDEGKPRDQVAVEFGLGSGTVQAAMERERGRRETIVDPQTLPTSAQEKLDTAIRQATRKLEAEFETRLQAALADALNEMVLPQYNKEIAQARQITESRKGIMDRATYRLIASCLHPDRVTDPDQKERYARAFRAFTERELVLCNEKDMPIPATAIPRTYEEMMRRRAEMKTRRRHQTNGVST